MDIWNHGFDPYIIGIDFRIAIGFNYAYTAGDLWREFQEWWNDVAQGRPPPCLKLKSFRSRAGITAKVAAKACNLSSANSFYRYEAVRLMGTTAIPDHIIKAIMPLIVGRGSPPVTDTELLSIASAHDLLNSTKTRSLPMSTVASTAAVGNNDALEAENMLLKKLYSDAMSENKRLLNALSSSTW
ncbi:MAG: hypothetical protein IPL91_00085 [Hyphomicrobium sp.]|nr:hypothetical protein [Hyphomicrobium sp.]